MTQQLILDLLPAPSPTLDNFVPGPNRAALDALRACGPGRAVYLWGAPGAGRSHLLKAVAASDQAFYFGAGQAPQALKEIATADTSPWQLVAIDNVELLDDAGQAALFALYNRWREAGSGHQGFALVLAGDRAPIAMPLREDLRTRLGWDLVFRLQLLSDQDRAQALATRARERGSSLTPDVVNWVLSHYSRDIRQLSALIDALDRYALAKHRAITVPLLKDLLASRQDTNDNDNDTP